MAINSETFISDILLFLRNSLRTNITHPEGLSNSFIFTAFPKENTSYPLITLKVTGLNSSSLGMYSEVSLVNVGIEIRVWAKNSKQSDEMTQNIIDLLRTLQYGTSSTTDQNIFGFKLTSCVPVVESDADSTIHSKVMEFNYICILGDNS